MLFLGCRELGNLYPFSGMMRTSSGADPTIISLAATKSRAAIHRHGFGLMAVGDAALCGGVPSPFMQKSPYRISMVYPIPETTGNHAMGSSTATWGLGSATHSPGPGMSMSPCFGDGGLMFASNLRKFISGTTPRSTPIVGDTIILATDMVDQVRVGISLLPLRFTLHAT